MQVSPGIGAPYTFVKRRIQQKDCIFVHLLRGRSIIFHKAHVNCVQHQL